MSRLDRHTLLAYQQCHYEVHAAPPFVLRIGKCSRELALLYRRHGQDCAAYLSACNPRGQLISPTSNSRATRRMQRLLARRGHAWLEGFGRDPQGVWPGEPSALVLGMEYPQARRIAARFGQNALLWMAADARVRLVLLR